MPKNIEDIIVPERKSIRDIPIPDSRRKIHAVDSFSSSNSSAPKKISHTPTPTHSTSNSMNGNLGRIPRGKYSKKSIWLGAGMAVIVLIFAIISFKESAVLTYVPKSTAVSFNKDVYTAYKNTENELLFSVIKLSSDKGATAPASGEEQVSRKSSGTIIVYNNSGTAPQRLIKTTRFETPDGKIYRIESDIVVPGRKTVDGVSVPGSLEVTVVADKPGDTYNIGLSDFTLPGLKGDARYTTVYARSKTSMTGGFVGTEKRVSPADLAKANESIEVFLKENLLSQARAQLPEDFVLFPDLVSIVYEDLPQSNQTGSEVTVNRRGNFYGVMFKKKDLIDYLAQKKSITEGDAPVDIEDLSSLSLSFVGQPSGDLLNASQISFQVDGNVSAIFVIDEEALKRDLLGIMKKDSESVVQSKYPSILSANAILRPFWKSSFPEDISKIKILKNIQK